MKDLNSRLFFVLRKWGSSNTLQSSSRSIHNSLRHVRVLGGRPGPGLGSFLVTQRSSSHRGAHQALGHPECQSVHFLRSLSRSHSSFVWIASGAGGCGAAASPTGAESHSVCLARLGPWRALHKNSDSCDDDGAGMAHQIGDREGL